MSIIRKISAIRSGLMGGAFVAALSLLSSQAEAQGTTQTQTSQGPAIVVANNLRGNPFAPGVFSFDVQVINNTQAAMIAYAFRAEYDGRYVTLVAVEDIGLGGQAPIMGPQEPKQAPPEMLIRSWRDFGTLGNFDNTAFDLSLVRLTFEIIAPPPPNYLIRLGPDPQNVPLVDHEFKAVPHRYDNTVLIQAGLVPSQEQPVAQPSNDPDLGLGGGGIITDGTGGDGTGTGTDAGTVEKPRSPAVGGPAPEYRTDNLYVDERGVTHYMDDQGREPGAGPLDYAPPAGSAAAQALASAAGGGVNSGKTDAAASGKGKAGSSGLGALAPTSGTLAQQGGATGGLTTGTAMAAEKASLPPMITISGLIKMADGRIVKDVVVTTDVDAKNATTVKSGQDGVYKLSVPRGWSGAITPVLADHQLSPGSRSFQKIVADSKNQDFQAEKFSSDLNKYFKIVYRRNDKPTTSGLIFANGGLRVMNGKDSDTLSIMVKKDHRGKAVPAIKELVSDAGMKRMYTEAEVSSVQTRGALERLTSRRGKIQQIKAKEAADLRLWFRRVSPRRKAEFNLPTVTIATTTNSSKKPMRLRTAGLNVGSVESKQKVLRYTPFEKNSKEATEETKDASAKGKPTEKPKAGK